MIYSEGGHRATVRPSLSDRGRLLYIHFGLSLREGMPNGETAEHHMVSTL